MWIYLLSFFVSTVFYKYIFSFDPKDDLNNYLIYFENGRVYSFNRTTNELNYGRIPGAIPGAIPGVLPG